MTSNTDSGDLTDSVGDVDQANYVPYDMDLVNALIDQFGQAGPVHQPAHPLYPPLHPPPPRLHAQEPSEEEEDGRQSRVSWVPYWCDPEFDDEYFIVRDEAGGTKRVRLHPHDKMRPALRPQDAVRNPTPYAQRFGIHPDHKGDGRSCLSPTTAESRRVGLSRVQETPTGVKDYITAIDTQPDLPREQIQAWSQLRRNLEYDEAYQRFLFDGATTDEKIEQGIHSLDDSPVQYDLTGPLHPLVRRFRWGTAGSPCHYNLYGMRGQWTPENDTVWMALQPALQIASRVLYSKHPYWTALLDVRSRHKVPSYKVPSSQVYGNLNCFSKYFDPSMPDPSTAAAHETLKAQGYDVVKAATGFLVDRLEIQLFHTAEDWPRGKGVPESCVMAQTIMTGDDTAPVPTRVELKLAMELLWPLLIPVFTPTEKAATSVMVANLLLHELAHAAEKAIEMLLRNAAVRCVDGIRQLEGQSTQVLDALGSLADEVIQEEGEPFYGDEPLAELGNAFENQLWGGSHRCTVQQNHSFFTTFDIQLNQWPEANWQPHLSEDTTTRLQSCPAPVDTFTTPVPTASFLRLFTRAFWDEQVGRYGHAALKLAPEKPTPTYRTRGYMRHEDLTAAFGDAQAKWLGHASDKLHALGLTVVNAYLRTCLGDTMESVWVLQRWEWERQTWPGRATELRRLTEDVDRAMDEAYEVLAEINTSAAAKAVRVRDHNEAVEAARASGRGRGNAKWSTIDGVATYARVLADLASTRLLRLVAAYAEVHQHCLWEIRCAESLVVDYVTQHVTVRQHLWDKAGDIFRKTLNHTASATLTPVLEELQEVRSLFATAGALRPEVDADLQRFATNLQLDVNQLRTIAGFFDSDHIARTQHDWRGRLTTIPAGRARSQHRDLERVAIREILKQPPAVRGLVETYLAIIDHRAVLQRETEARGEEAVLARLAEVVVEQDGPARPAPGRGMFLLTTAAGMPSEERAAPSEGILTAAENGMDQALVTDWADMTPWTNAPPPANTDTSSPTFDPSPVPAGEAQPAIFSPLELDDSDFYSFRPASPTSDPADQQSSFPPPMPIRWGPFGTAWSDYRTVTEEVRRAGSDNVPGPVGVLGQEIFERDRLREKIRRRELGRRWRRLRGGRRR